MGWLTDRLTARRLALVAAILVLAGGLIAIGDPLAHGEAGDQDSGERGLTGVPRIAEVTALVVAFILAMPPSEPREDGDEGG